MVNTIIFLKSQNQITIKSQKMHKYFVLYISIAKMTEYFSKWTLQWQYTCICNIPERKQNRINKSQYIYKKNIKSPKVNEYYVTEFLINICYTRILYPLICVLINRKVHNIYCRAIIWIIVVEVNQRIQHIKYLTSRPYGFIQEDISKVFSICLWPRGAPILTLGQ